MEYRMTVKGNFYGKNKIFPSLNDYIHACSRHPQAGARMKRDYQMIACNAIRTQIGRVTIKRPIRIHYYFYEPDCKRDISNVASFFVKVYEDALQDCKVISNDNWAHIKGYTQDFEIDAVNPRVEIVIEEL